MTLAKTLEFIRGFYASYLTPEGGRYALRMETVDGHLFVVDKQTWKVLAEFNADETLHYLEQDLLNGMLDDEIDNQVRHNLPNDPTAHKWGEWEAAGGTRPPLRKTCGPWVHLKGEWVREDYRGEICVSVRPVDEGSGWSFQWNAELYSQADFPGFETFDSLAAGGSGYTSLTYTSLTSRFPSRTNTTAEDVAMHDADAWMLASGWIFVEDGTWKPRGLFFT